MPRDAERKGRLLVLAGCVSALVAGAGALRADLMVSRAFDRAFGQQGDAPFETSQANSQTKAGDDGYWLTRADVANPVFSKPLAIGDRITITDRDGRDRH